MILLWSLFVVGFIIAVAAIGILTVQKRFEPEARKWLLAAIEKHYQSGVEIGAFHASLYPIPRASVEDIVVRFHGRTDVPPLAKIRRMTIEARLWGVWKRPVHITNLVMEGLEIAIPPKENHAERHPEHNPTTHKSSEAAFILEHVVADGMLLRLIPRDPAKDPRDFEFEKLTLESAALDRPLSFQAKLANWKPPGKVESTGHFGPWSAGDPGSTPLDGKYTFSEADLSVFHGISGTLSSAGEYRGRLDRIECSGTTDTPDFKLSVGRPVDLKTEFHAIVDGINGDTILDPVTAHFRNSTVVARGGVINLPPHKGKNISLTVDVQKGRVEDFLHLVVNASQPMLVGGLAFRADFDLPPGKGDVMEKLHLKGHLNMPSARFTSVRVQDILGHISRRAEGDPKGEVDENVASSFSSDFVLGNSQCSFSRLVFDVPGAEVRLSGTYGVHDGGLNFVGQARTDAKLSQMTTGVASKLLKFVDPFFAKQGAGAVLPIRITGTRSSPHFGLNFHKAKQ
jgi:hypothetical protein